MSKDKYLTSRTMANVWVEGIARLGLMVVLLVIVLLVAAPSVQAISFDITSDHADGVGGLGPTGTIFGTVTLLDNGTGGVDVTVHLNSGYSFVKTGSVDFQAFKFNGTGVAVGDITIDPHTPTLAAATGAFNGDGTGNFLFGINAPTQGSGGSDPFTTDIVFHVANAVIGDLTVSNNLGNIFVADLLSSSTGNTGPADVTGVKVPEPTSMLLLGLGLLAVVGVRRKLKN